MFTGLIEELGTIISMQHTAQGGVLSVAAPRLSPELKTGDSVATNGVCLTVTTVTKEGFTADVMPLTLVNTNLGELKVGCQVNLERAMTLHKRLDGHMVTGHIDAKGVVSHIEQVDNALIFDIKLSEEIVSRLIDRGSIAINGISLTIQNLFQERVRVSIIPHTAKATTMATTKIGDVVNVETDVIGKYVVRFFENTQQAPKINRAFLNKCGFL